MNWVFWQDTVSPHLAPLVRTLASVPNQTVTVVASEELSEARKLVGWKIRDCSPARVMVMPQDIDVEQLIIGTNAQQSIHLLGGYVNVALNRRVLPRLLAQSGAIVGLISESADNRGILGIARKAKYCLDRHFMGRNVDFILAMGQLGVRWFESVGYDSLRIFPFGYVTERPDEAGKNNGKTIKPGPFRILYIGQIIRRKDGITAMRALGALSTSDWQFNVVGNGPDLSNWEEAASVSGHRDRIHFRRAVDYGMVGPLFEEADLLLLPSKWDGWGAVVNEALMCGVPVICSDRCGAADLLHESWRGSIFKTGSVESLRSMLQEWIERGRNKESSSRIKQWSSRIEASQFARYLVETVEYVRDGGQRPYPPWY